MVKTSKWRIALLGFVPIVLAALGIGNAKIIPQIVSAAEVTFEKYVTEGHTMENLAESQRWAVDIPTDLSMYNGFSYHIDTTETSKVSLFQQLTESSGEEWKTYEVNSMQVAFFYPDDGSAYFWGIANHYPAGFKGKVVVPLTSFRAINSSSDRVFDTSALNGKMTFVISATSGGRLTIKDLQFVTDAKTIITVEHYPQRPEGDYGSDSYMAIHKEEVLAGAESYTPRKIPDYVFDENNTKNKLNNYTNNNEKNFIKQGLCGSGIVAGSYRPIVYYKLYPQDIEKVFGLENVKSSYSADTYTKVIMQDFPQGGILIGTERKDLLQLEGEWKAVKRKDTSITIEFQAKNMPETVKDSKGLLTVVIPFTPAENTGVSNTDSSMNSGNIDSDVSTSPTISSVNDSGMGCGGTLLSGGSVSLIILTLGNVVMLRKGGKKE